MSAALTSLSDAVDRADRGRMSARRRPLRASAIQAGYVLTAVAVGLVAHRVSIGFTIPAGRAVEMLVAIATGMVAFIGIVYSLLFLVVQFGSTSFTPRLTIFRDTPIVWHAFGMFTAVIVYCLTASLVVVGDQEVAGTVPVVAAAGLLVSLTVYRWLQTRAFRSIQLSAVLDQVARRGQDVIDVVYPDAVGTRGASTDPRALADGAARRDVRWDARTAILQGIDVEAAVRAATAADAQVHFRVRIGDTIQQGAVLATVHGAGDVDETAVRSALEVGHERTFEHDPRLALRVLADIALRALSSAINDPTTAVQALDCTETLLRSLAGRDLDVGPVADAAGRVRVTLALPTWDEYVGVAFDEITAQPIASPHVRERIRSMFDALAESAPPPRRAALSARRPAITGRAG